MEASTEWIPMNTTEYLGCQGDECGKVDDTIAIIVGSCLAGLVILVLIGYLIMRWKNPPQYI